MRQSMAKATRRDLRRAMGETGLAEIGRFEQAVAILSNTVANQQREIASLAVNHAEFKKSATIVNGATFNSLAEFCGRSLRGSLRWLFTGK